MQVLPLGKMTKTLFSKRCERASELLEFIHSDVCGPMSTTVRGGFQYFVTFTGNLSRYGYVYLMRHKLETFENFKEFHNEVENQLSKKINLLRSDRGGEYMSQEFDDHLKSRGIVPQLTPPRYATEKWHVRTEESDSVGDGPINDESVGFTLVILGIRSRNCSFHTAQGTI